MVVLSAHFALLACLCAALPLAFSPVEAAHLYSSYPVEKHVSSPYSQQRTRTRTGSFFGRPTATHRHDGKNNGHQAPNNRASELPSLLRRYGAHDRNKVHNQHGQGPHDDDAHHKVPRSAFARSRYRRAPAYLSPRSSVYVTGEHGNTYIVSRTPPRNWGNGHTGTDKQSSHTYNRRQDSNLVLGRVDIMESPGSAQRLASLTVDSIPIDWTSGQSSAKVFPLNASTANQTQFIMLPADETSNAAGSSNKHVTIATEVFDASSAGMVMYCATYDSDPGATSPLLMTPCTSTGTTHSTAPADDAADPCADDTNDASSSNSHESQIFSYDPSSGQIEPISTTDSSSGTGDSSDDLASCAGARVRRDNGNSTTSGSVRPSSTSTSTAPTTSASQQARNVTLVFVAGALEVPASSPSSSNTTTTSTSQASVLTKTITTTVVAAATVQAEVSVSASSIAPPSTTISAPSGFTTATTARSSLSISSSVSATATSSAPANADASFEVEIVGIAPSTTASSSSMSTTTTTKATSSSSSGSVSTSLDALAVASSIANAMVSPQRAIFASASITTM